MANKTLSARIKYKVLGTLLIIVGMVFIFPFNKEQQQESTPVYAIAEEVVTTSIDIQSPRINKFMDKENVDLDVNIETQNLLAYINPGVNYIRSSKNPDLERPLIPDRISIPAIELDAPVISAEFHFTDLDGDKFGQWKAPSTYAAGWHPDSALLGMQGNTVINGHHNVHGEVFKELVNLEIGDEIVVYSNEKRFIYIISNRMIVPERYADAETRIENARWLGRSDDERLTLVTCWPESTNSHRLILVARPFEVKNN